MGNTGRTRKRAAVVKALVERTRLEEEGATLIEYALILALIVFITAGVLIPSRDPGRGALPKAVNTHFNTKAGPLNPAGR